MSDTAQLDQSIKQRRKVLPWAIINLPRFIQDIAARQLKTGDPKTPVFKLKVYPRPKSDYPMLYELSWVNANNEWMVVTATNWELLLFRAAETEMQARESSHA